MILYKKSSDLKKFLNRAREAKESVGFVPTMGAIHHGHALLMKMSKSENNITVVSIFVNPLQFNDRDDYIKYPRTIENDLDILSKLDVDIVFLPGEDEMYPATKQSDFHFDPGYLETVFEGQSRPGHFRGVARVMDILLDTVCPARLYLGRKDYQQTLVIKKLISFKKLAVEVVIAPIVREENGLAGSSRNERLSASARNNAGLLYKSLLFIKTNAANSSYQSLKEQVVDRLEKAGFLVDYLELANADTIKVMTDFDFSVPMIVLLAVQTEGIRLIDNVLV